MTLLPTVYRKYNACTLKSSEKFDRDKLMFHQQAAGKGVELVPIVIRVSPLLLPRQKRQKEESKGGKDGWEGGRI